jgi:hypothetical protein
MEREYINKDDIETLAIAVAKLIDKDEATTGVIIDIIEQTDKNTKMIEKLRRINVDVLGSLND